MTAVRCYLRVSTDEQAASGFSLAAQRESLAAYALSQGWTIAGWYVDDGYSAKDTNRPAFQRLLAEARQHDVVLVHKLDRLTRAVRDLDELLHQFEQQGIQFRSVTEVFETTTASGRLFLRIVGEIAQWERETISERTRMGKQARVAAGEWGGGPVPFGYLGRPSDKVKRGKVLLKLVPDPVRASLVPEIFQRYLHGQGLRALCIWLNDEIGARTGSGARFRVTTLARILTNPLYCGDVQYGRRGQAPGQPTRVPGSHPPLISREIFDRTQAVFALRKTYAPRQATGRYPLAGVARCGVCGGRIDTVRRGAADAGPAYAYRCHNYANGTGCGPPTGKPLASVSGRAVEENLLHLLGSFARTAPLREFLAACDAEYLRQAGQAATDDRRRLQQDLAAAERAVGRWARAFETGKVDPDEYTGRTQAHRERIRTLQANLAALPDIAATPPATALDTGSIDLRPAWQHLTPPERKVLLQHFCQAFGVQIVVYPDRRVELRPAATPRAPAAAR